MHQDGDGRHQNLEKTSEDVRLDLMLVLIEIWLNVSILEHILDGLEQNVLLLHREGCLTKVCAEQALKVKIC